MNQEDYLTRRQAEVLAMRAEGMTILQTARTLGIDVSVVKYHRKQARLVLEDLEWDRKRADGK